MMRMKELWSYLLGLFDGAERPGKALRRARDPAEYRTQAAAILRSAGLRTESRGIF